ncbi:formylglycine-generating enzyme family protein [Endothiovibrio diazotrophicus]
MNLAIDYSRHPLADGHPPHWASGWGEDRFGPFVEIAVDEVVQRLRWCPPGAFRMGSPEDEVGRYDDEGPRHRVVIERGFWLFDTPVTQALWVAVMGENPSRFQSAERPVERVSWKDAQAFVERINRRIPGLALELPSEARWEYACRAGTEGAIHGGELEILGDANAPALDPIAWYGGNSGEAYELAEGEDLSFYSDRQYEHEKSGTHPVKRKASNDWGLYDMLGNVWEWTGDHWHERYEGAPADGAPWLAEGAGALRVIRGVSWFDGARGVRAACRSRDAPGDRVNYLGFRCARVQA